MADIAQGLGRIGSARLGGVPAYGGFERKGKIGVWSLVEGQAAGSLARK